MRLPDAIEQEIRSIEAEYEARPGQRAGTPRLRGLRSTIETHLQELTRMETQMALPLESDNDLSWDLSVEPVTAVEEDRAEALADADLQDFLLDLDRDAEAEEAASLTDATIMAWADELYQDEVIATLQSTVDECLRFLDADDIARLVGERL